MTKASSATDRPSSLVNELFDRAMQSQPFPGLALEALPQRMAAAQPREPECSRLERQTDEAFATGALREPATPVTVRPIQFSPHELNRVADKVAVVLTQRARFERERKGRLS